jgi:cytochrome P450
MATIAAREIESWPTGTPYKLRPRMQAITLEIILETVFGVHDRERMDPLRAALRDFLDLTTDPRFLLPVVLMGPERIRRISAFRRRVDRVDELIHREIAERRLAEDLAERDDILSMLVAAEFDDGSRMSDRELRDQLMTLLLAGHETTATALAWAFERLVRHPAALTRLREEADADDDTYVDAVVKETLRSRPVVIDVARTLAAPARVGGYDLPAGVMVVPMITLVQTGPGAWEDPGAFRPERFLDGAQPDPYTWIPFGGGVRRCLGASFATFEMKVVLETLLPAADLIPSSPEPEAARLRHVTLVPARGAEVVLERRRPVRPRTAPAAVAA